MKIGIDYIGITTPFYCHDGRGNFLFHKRSKNCRDEHLCWDLGSGKLDHGFSLEENVLKEVEEEYGCKGILGEQLPPHDIFREHNGQKTHWIAVPFFVVVKPNEVVLNEPEKMLELGWFTLNNLPTPIHSGFEYTFNRYRDYFDKYLK
ncbi:MAG: NUDIX domain-containing protein [Patescibacteria group bacterium]